MLPALSSGSSMKAVRVQRGGAIAPFNDQPGALPVLGEALEATQAAAVAAAGLELVAEPPRGEAHIRFSDRTWFTPEAVRRLVAAGEGRLQTDDADFLSTTSPQQRLAAPGVFELALHPGDDRPMEALPPVRVDLGLQSADLPEPHPRLRHAIRPIRMGLAMVHQVDHWTHVLRINHLALAALGLRLKRDFEAAPIWKRVGGALWILAKARSVHPAQIGAALTVRGAKAKIHPTAVVEASQIGPGAEIGAHAVVRGSIIGPGARVEEHTTVLGSVIGANAIIARYAMCNFCVVMAEGQLSFGDGWQFCIVGRGAFVAWGATGLDLSFGGPVKVEQDGERVSSGHHLLGVAIGHRAVVGNGVRLHHGVAVPNDAVVVASADDLLRYPAVPEGVEGPFLVERGRLVPARRRPTPQGSPPAPEDPPAEG